MGISDAEYEDLLALMRAGRFQEMEARCLVVTKQHPEDGRAWQLLGAARLSAGRDREAVEALTRASELTPDNASVWDNLGLAWHRVKDYERADACFRRCVRLQPDRLTAWLNWSVSASFAGNAEAAEAHARQALRLNPKQADGWLNLGNALLDRNLYADAEAAYRKALELNPHLTETRLSYAMLLDRQGRLQEAIQAFEAFLKARPNDWRGHAGLGKIYSSLGRSSLASAAYRRAVECDASAAEAYSGLLFLRLYEEGATSMSVYKDHRDYGASLDAAHQGARRPHDNDRDLERRLRVGFVSGDFRVHAVAFFLEPFLEALDRQRLTVLLYAANPTPDAMTERLRRLADVWVDVSRMSDEHMAERIRADAVDILVDLSGHSSYNRLPVFARRPAPVQVSWLGYPSSTGMTSIDYRPIFETAAFPGIEAQFSEQLVYLPCGPTFRHPIDLPEVGPLPAARGKGVTFASLNRSDKLGDGVIRAWARILAALPSARLLIGAAGEAALQADLTRRLGREGIAPERIEFRPRLPMRDYLELHRQVDILLDPFPFSGLTTSLHALWMGVPVLTLAGDSLVKRQGVVLNLNLGLEAWVAESEEDYVRKAVALASDIPGLVKLRAGLRQRIQASPLGSPDLEARCVATAFREMWWRRCGGLPARAFRVELPEKTAA
jgi:predicted O-linked N-acetylglucosamine transferase (SPINDLY family)